MLETKSQQNCEATQVNPKVLSSLFEKIKLNI